MKKDWKNKETKYHYLNKEQKPGFLISHLHLVTIFVFLIIAVIFIKFGAKEILKPQKHEPPQIGDTFEAAHRIKFIEEKEGGGPGRDMLVVPVGWPSEYFDEFHMGTPNEQRWINSRVGDVIKVRGRLSEPSEHTCHIFYKFFGSWRNGNYMPKETEDKENCNVYRITDIDSVEKLR